MTSVCFRCLLWCQSLWLFSFIRWAFSKTSHSKICWMRDRHPKTCPNSLLNTSNSIMQHLRMTNTAWPWHLHNLCIFNLIWASAPNDTSIVHVWWHNSIVYHSKNIIVHIICYSLHDTNLSWNLFTNYRNCGGLAMKDYHLKCKWTPSRLALLPYHPCKSHEHDHQRGRFSHDLIILRLKKTWT